MKARRAVRMETSGPGSPRRETSRMAKPASPCFREKPLGRNVGARTKTDTGGRVEYTEAIGRTMVKELGILTP